MGLLGRKGRAACALVSVIGMGMPLMLPVMAVQAAGTDNMAGRIQAGQEEDYIELRQENIEYEVRPGDCLWDIAEEFWGDGSLYGDIVMHNQESIADPDMIYPGTRLEIGNSIYIKKQNPYGKISMWRYVFYMPDGSTVGVSDFGDNGANFCLSGNGRIACLVQDKTEEAVRTTSDWEACAKLIYLADEAMGTPGNKKETMTSKYQK